ncbi:MarR family winged helix-turn-helix transcriptional regulator [Micromonospora sp. GCM10011542]|uniref:MarR family winged helix-turn-helix transcriptional regulator n=1 Tax=Micromonospora sp. GCM10011542 TaxID=3317337 RepID=UPI00360A00E6
MAELHGPPDPETSMAAALDATAGALLSVWESARERTTSRVSGAQLRAVMVVERHDGINLRRLADRLDMLLSSASRLCDRLVAAGLMEREPGRFDRREISLHLTPDGRRLIAELRAERHAQLTAILAGMSAAGRDALLSGMREFDDSARRQEAAQAASAPTDPDGSDDPEPSSRPEHPEPSSGRAHLQGSAGSADPATHAGQARPERPVGLTREWSTGDPSVARTA